MIFGPTGPCRGDPNTEIWLKMLQISLFSFQYVNELSGGNQGGQARENRSDILKRKIPPGRLMGRERNEKFYELCDRS